MGDILILFIQLELEKGPGSLLTATVGHLHPDSFIIKNILTEDSTGQTLSGMLLLKRKRHEVKWDGVLFIQTGPK